MGSVPILIDVDNCDYLYYQLDHHETIIYACIPEVCEEADAAFAIGNSG